jgi:drug/metabolite transporter (DMT)-like permease
MGAATTLALGAILAKRPLRAYSSLRVTTWMALFGGLTLLPAGLPALLTTPRSAITPSVLTAAAFTILISTIIGQIAWNYAIKRLGAARTMAYTYLQPVVGIAIAAILLGERLQAVQFLGGAIVLLGLALYSGGVRWLRALARSRETAT